MSDSVKRLMTEEQQDTLPEVINIATGRTAASLSALAGQRVHIEIPELDLLTLPELIVQLNHMTDGEVATVQQVFGGAFQGMALLLLDQPGAIELVSKLVGGRVQSGRLDTSSQEVLVEVGNMLLNACIGSFGNLLKVHLSFSVPRIMQQVAGDILSTLTIEGQGITHALMIHTIFRLSGDAIQGRLVILLGVTSLDRLLSAIQKLSESVHNA